MNNIAVEFDEQELKFTADMITALYICYGCGKKLKMERDKELEKKCRHIAEKLENAERQLRESSRGK